MSTENRNKIVIISMPLRQAQVTLLTNSGQYNAPSELNCTNSAVGFADRVPRKLWETSTTPGPGQYNSGL